MNRLNKLVQALKTGGLVYAVQKIKLYIKRKLKNERKFSWADYAFEELPIQDVSANEYDVSVLIPAYNAGIQFKTMLELLQQQKNCGKVEIVVVDSGSTDGTLELCKEYKTTLIQIPNEQFSHSYARNLGAEAAKGEILLFMTQDALPSSEEWLYEMILSIVQEEADAVSCGEQCPVGTDLYYRIANYGHASFVGFLKEDLVGSKEKCRDKESLRRYASLSDVACAIKRSVFLRFRHRYDFAEDLDLGVRLLACGYKTKLLAQTKVLHGHNRTADYYLKRAIVEREAFGKIFPEEIEQEKPEVVESRIYYSACVIARYLAELQQLEYGNSMLASDFIKCASDIFDGAVKEFVGLLEYKEVLDGSAPLLESVIKQCIQNRIPAKHPTDKDLAYSVRFYLDNIAEYMAYCGVTTMEDSVEAVCECVVKQFALCVGTELVKLKKEEIWNRKILELIKGV